MQIRLSARHIRRRTTVIALLWIAAQALPAEADIPKYVPKPATWTSELVTYDNRSVSDKEFAGWVKAAQKKRPFDLLASFTQCFGGGFLEELKNQGVTTFGANSASRYFEPASYDARNGRAYYPFSWAEVAKALVFDDDITDVAYNATVDGLYPGIPANPWAQRERAQYLSDVNSNVPPTALRSADFNYAILFVGQPHLQGWDAADVTQLFEVLTKWKGFKRENIWILFGEGWDEFDTWSADGPATRETLRDAFQDWLPGRLEAQGVDPDPSKPSDKTVQVFFWAGDHGTAKSPVAISVAEGDQGYNGDVFLRSLIGQPVGSVIYEAGRGTNVAAWHDPLDRDVDAISFGNDFPKNRSLLPPIYFSVDRLSRGAAGTDVADEIARGRAVAPDVFVETDRGNRKMFDGQSNFGLVDVPSEAYVLQADEVDALAMRNVLNIADPVTNTLSRRLFFSLRNSPEILVYDPDRNGVNVYPYVTPLVVNGVNVIPPWEVDALALYDDGATDNNGRYYFDVANDVLLFSIGRQETVAPWTTFKPCDVLSYAVDPKDGVVKPAVFRSCAALGLAATDNVDALDLGARDDGQPIQYGDDDGPDDTHYPPNPGTSPSPTPTSTPTPVDPDSTPTWPLVDTNTPTAPSTDTPTATSSDTPTAEPTDTPPWRGTDTPTAEPTDTPTAEATDTSTPESAVTPTGTPALGPADLGTADRILSD